MKLFDTTDFPARWQCGRWSTAQGSLHIASDLAVWLAYLTIPCMLGLFILRKKSVPFRPVMWLFVAFILACGTTHLMEAVIFWWPAYRLAGIIKLLTATVSWITVFALVYIIPKALAFRTPEEFEREIAERKRAEASLLREQDLLHTLMDNLPDNIYFKDAGSRFVRINRALTTYFGLSAPGQALGKSDADFFAPEHADKARADEQRIIHVAQPLVGIEEKQVWLDGRVGWVSTTKMPFRDKDGTIIGTFGISRDITERKRLESELRKANERLELAVRSSNIALWEQEISDDMQAGPVAWLNFWEQWGADGEDQTNAAALALVHPDDRERLLHLIASYLAGEVMEFKSEHRAQYRDGSYHWMLSRGVLLRDSQGKALRFTGSTVDITDLKHAQEATEAANRAKDEFLANVSHEIRTPMNAILGMTELVLETPLSDDQRRSLKTVKSAADSLLGIINDLLDFSKIEAGKLELDSADFSLRGILGDTLRVLAVRAHRKGLELISQVQPDVPDGLVGDPIRLRQVLLNLVGNALKFTEEGEVVITVEIADSPATPQSGICDLRFSVRDTGIGIAPDKKETIFRAFEQEDTSTTRKYGGTGLGLTIAARIVSLMGGSIHVESEPGRGSTFSFTARFTCQAQQTAPAHPLVPPLLYGLSVLVVDDNETNRHILVEWLRGWQMEPTDAGDGMAAMDALWHRAANGRPFALVLLDARMPDTDGLTVAAKIRERAELAATRIILLTSGDRPGDAARFGEPRIEAHLLKPVQPDELLMTIYQAMSQPAAAATLTQAATAPSTIEPAPAIRSLRILVAEDNEISADVIEQMLVRQGHQVQVATNGKETVALAQAQDFDLLLLDLHMPEMDGFQVIHALRNSDQARARQLPVIALTARSRKEDRARCEASGMCDFLTKPIRAADLLPAIARAVDRKKASLNLIDAQTLLTACGEDADLLHKMCRSLETRLPEQLAELRNSLQSHDFHRLREAAHKCCGLLSEFSTVAGGLAGDLEDLAASQQFEEASAILQELESTSRAILGQVGLLSLEVLRMR